MLSYLLVQMTENSPELIDYVFVYWLLGIFEEEKRQKQKVVKSLLKKYEKTMIEEELQFTTNNLKDLNINFQPITINVEDTKSKKIDKLVNKQFEKLSRQIRGQVLNALNTGNMIEIENLLGTLLKKKEVSNSIVSNLMRIYRTENTLMRSKIKLEIQAELKKQGIIVKRKWLHTLSNPLNTINDDYKPREDHLALNGTLEDSNGYFHTSSASGKAPGMFNIPEEDINCRCDVTFTQ